MHPSPTWPQSHSFQSRFIELDGLRMHYIDEGEGAPVVFSHGNPTWSFYWRHLMAGLRDRFRVIACDHLGCGLSDKPQRYDYCLARHSQNLGYLVEHLDLPKYTLVGHDWGGAIGLHCGLVARPGSLQRVVLFNTAAFPPDHIPWRISLCRSPLLGTILLRGLNVFPRAALHMAVSRNRRWTQTERDNILAPYGSWHDRVGICRFVGDIPATPQHPTYQVLRELHHRLVDLQGTPVRIVWGMQDWCFDSTCLRRLREAIPHAQVTALPTAGHWVVEDAPQETLHALQEFLLCPNGPRVNQQA